MPANDRPPAAAPRPGWDWRRFWRYSRALVAPLAIWALLLLALLLGPLPDWLHGEESYDESALREWLEEARFPNLTLAEMVDEYIGRTREYAELLRDRGAFHRDRVGELPDRAGGVAESTEDTNAARCREGLHCLRDLARGGRVELTGVALPLNAMRHHR